ncbi:MAG: hypothetical protein AAFV25_16585 [Bacteroidota bacterium]
MSLGAIVLFFLASTKKCNKTSDFIDCHPDRATKTEVKDQSGIIQHVNGDNWVIVYGENGNRRYLPCNLEKSWQTDNKRVRFDGLEKEIHANERWVGTPFVLQKIREE